MSIKDIEIDDTELHEKSEEIMKEINKKNRKWAEEIYDFVHEQRENGKKE